jgi:hypothetical protein
LVYDADADTWAPSADMPEPRAGGTAVVLADGSVMVVGGSVVDGDAYHPLRSAVILTPAP